MTQKDKISPTHSTLRSNTSPSVAHSFSQVSHLDNMSGQSLQTHEGDNYASYNSTTPLLSTTVAGTSTSAATKHAIQTEMTPQKARKPTSAPKKLWYRVKRVLGGKTSSPKGQPVDAAIKDRVQVQDYPDDLASTPSNLRAHESRSPESLATSMSKSSRPRGNSDSSKATTGYTTDATSVCACDYAPPQQAVEEKPAASGQDLQVPAPKPRQHRSKIPVPVPKPITNGTEYGSRVTSMARSSGRERAGPGNPLAAAKREGERKRTMALPAAATRE